MPGCAYLLLGDIKGETQTKGLEGYIEVDSYSFGASNPADIGSGGLSGGVISLSDFSFTCNTDKSSGDMLKQLFSGKPVDSATFKLFEASGGDNIGDPYVTVTFTNCLMTGQSFGGGSQGKPSQSISFAFEQIVYAYGSQTSDSGVVSNAANAGFNVVKHASVG
jgi:type VI secretion system secreted protein Hcp